MYGEGELPDPIPDGLRDLLHRHRKRPNDPTLGMNIYLQIEAFNNARIHRQHATHRGWPTHPDWSVMPARIHDLRNTIHLTVYGSGLFESPIWNKMPAPMLRRLVNNQAPNDTDVRCSRVG
jgi:hypothetical protein